VEGAAVRGRYFDGECAPFRSNDARKKLIGKKIRFLRGCDIDRSGRGYIFPRFGTVEGTAGRSIFLECGGDIFVSDLVEVQIIEEDDQ
jgi:hypothetical protein